MGSSSGPAKPGSFLVPVGGRPGHDDLDLGSPFRSASELEPPSDLLRALAHTLEAPVPVAPTLLEKRRVDAATVVTDADPELLGSVVDRDVDAASARVGQRVEERLAPDGGGLFEQHRVESARPASGRGR